MPDAAPDAAAPRGPRTLVLGESLVDRVQSAEGSVAEHVGGSPANVAMGLARLGVPVDFATRFGPDERGRRIASHLGAHGVTVHEGSAGAARTSLAEAVLRADGSAEYAFSIEWDLPPVEVAAGVGHVHVGSIGAVLEPGATSVRATLEAARPQATVSFDPNVRPMLMGAPEEVRARVEALVALADVVKASDEDLSFLYAGTPVPEVLRLWGRLGPRLVVVTRGGEGAVFGVTGRGEVASEPAGPAEVVDTVGAGDSFMAGLVSGLLDAGLLGSPSARERLGEAALADVRPSVHRAVRCGAATVSRAGAYAPVLAELDL